MIYCDTSALTKLVLGEPESDAFRAFISGDSIVSSALARTELPRSVLRRSPLAHKEIAEIILRTSLLALTPSLLDRAGLLPPPLLRSLDAIHIASALLVRAELTAFVSYDDRMLEAAAVLGLPTASPR